MTDPDPSPDDLHTTRYEVLAARVESQPWYRSFSAAERVCIRWALAEVATFMLEQEGDDAP